MVGDKLHSTDNLRIASFIGSKSQSGTKLCSGLELAQNVILAQVTASDGFAHSRYCAGTGEHDAWNTLFSCLCGGSSSVVASSVYYMVFGKALMALLPSESVAVDMRKVPAWKKAAEFVRGLVVAFVVGWFVAQLGVVDWKGALRFAAF